jgi:hypothetical protein
LNKILLRKEEYTNKICFEIYSSLLEEGNLVFCNFFLRNFEKIFEKYDFNYTVLCEVVDCVTFVERLISIKQSVNWGDPYTLNTGYIVICIEYENGDYDWVYSNTQSKIRDGKSTGGGYICFEKEQFTALLNDYLPENEQIG